MTVFRLLQVNYDGIFLVEDSPPAAEHEAISPFHTIDKTPRGAGLASLLSSSYEAEGTHARVVTVPVMIKSAMFEKNSYVSVLAIRGRMQCIQSYS